MNRSPRPSGANVVSALSGWKELLGLNEIEVLDLDEGQPPEG